MRTILLGTGLLFGMITNAQDTTLASVAPLPQDPLTFSGYVESYYTYDLNKPVDNNRPGFIYSHNRHNEFNINLAYIKGSYAVENARANVAIATGTYMNANYSAEPGVLKNIYEANAGFKLGKKNLWIDAGIFSSHIGFESAHSPSCWTLTRSLMADNTPYYEAGAKLTYTSPNNKWVLSGLVLNGWQRIKRVDGNSLMSFGSQVTYKPKDDITLNYSTFIGTDKPDSIRQMRYFHNIYGIFQVSHNIGLIAGFDIGTEEKNNGSGMNTWYSPILIAKYTINDKWSLTARGEYYDDEDGVIIATVTQNGFKTTGISINVDYAPAKNMLIRFEGRTLKSKDPIFSKGTQSQNSNTFFTSSFAISF